MAALAGLLGATWAFVGVEHLVGDHEIGMSWEPFIKHIPTWRIRFDNPAQKGLDIVPLAGLSEAERQKLASFCEARFGESNLQQCHERLSARMR